MKADLLKLLRDDVALGGLLGQFDGHSMIYWSKRPREAVSVYPALLLTGVSKDDEVDQTGHDGLTSSRVQIDITGPDQLINEQIAARLSNLLVLKMVGATREKTQTTGQTEFTAGYLESERDLSALEEGDGVDICRLSLDFILWHRPKAA